MVDAAIIQLKLLEISAVPCTKMAQCLHYIHFHRLASSPLLIIGGIAVNLNEYILAYMTYLGAGAVR